MLEATIVVFTQLYPERCRLLVPFPNQAYISEMSSSIRMHPWQGCMLSYWHIRVQNPALPPISDHSISPAIYPLETVPGIAHCENSFASADFLHSWMDC